MRVSLSSQALVDLEGIIAFTLVHHGTERARGLRSRITTALETLAVSPFSGRKRPEFDPAGKSYRYSIVLWTYLLAYEVTEEGVRVSRILHGARNVARELERRPGDNGSVREALPIYGESTVPRRQRVQSRKAPSLRRQPVPC